jgi:hypothetical protein
MPEVSIDLLKAARSVAAFSTVVEPDGVGEEWHVTLWPPPSLRPRGFDPKLVAELEAEHWTATLDMLEGPMRNRLEDLRDAVDELARSLEANRIAWGPL